MLDRGNKSPPGHSCMLEQCGLKAILLLLKVHFTSETRSRHPFSSPYYSDDAFVKFNGDALRLLNLANMDSFSSS